MTSETDIYHRFYLSKNSQYVDIRHATYHVMRRTPRGAWIQERGALERWVSDNTEKAYAYADPKRAWNSFQIRMQHRKTHAKNELVAVTAALNVIGPESPVMETLIARSNGRVRVIDPPVRGSLFDDL